MSLEYKKSDKPRLNYDVLIAKAQKKQSGSEKEKIVKPKDFDPARPDHVYEGNQVAVRRLFTEVVRKQTHNFNPGDFDRDTGR